MTELSTGSTEALKSIEHWIATINPGTLIGAALYFVAFVVLGLMLTSTLNSSMRSLLAHDTECCFG